MATRSSILAWKIPWTVEPGGLYSSCVHKESDTAEARLHCVDEQPPKSQWLKRAKVNHVHHIWLEPQIQVDLLIPGRMEQSPS